MNKLLTKASVFLLLHQNNLQKEEGVATINFRPGAKKGTIECSVMLLNGIDSEESQVARELISNGAIKPLNAEAFKDILLFGTGDAAEEQANQAAHLINTRVKELRENQSLWLFDDHP